MLLCFVCIILMPSECQRVLSAHTTRIFEIQVENLGESFIERKLICPG